MSSDAAKRAAARRAKIMARGNAGLAKLAQTARGEEAGTLYGEEIAAPAVSQGADTSTSTSTTASAPQATASSAAPSASAATSAPAAGAGTTRPSFAAVAAEPPAKTNSLAPPAPASSSRSRPGWAADPAAASGAATPSEQEEQMRQQVEAMMAMLGGGPNGAPGAGPGAGEMPDMASMFAQMMGGGGSPFGGPGDPGGNPFAALGGPGGPGAGGEDMPNPFAMLQGMGGGAGMPPGMFGAPEAPPSRAARRFPLLHVLVIAALVAFIAYWWEPNLHMVRAGDFAARAAGDWARRWAGLAGDVGDTSRVEKLPVFWAFVTLEVLLLTTRLTLVRAGSGLHPLLANVLPMLPPAAQHALRAAARALPALAQTYRDGCLFVFGLGAAVVFAEWRARADFGK